MSRTPLPGTTYVYGRANFMGAGLLRQTLRPLGAHGLEDTRPYLHILNIRSGTVLYPTDYVEGIAKVLLGSKLRPTQAIIRYASSDEAHATVLATEARFEETLQDSLSSDGLGLISVRAAANLLGVSRENALKWGNALLPFVEAQDGASPSLRETDFREFYSWHQPITMQ